MLISGVEIQILGFCQLHAYQNVGILANSLEKGVHTKKNQSLQGVSLPPPPPFEVGSGTGVVIGVIKTPGGHVVYVESSEVV
jgi:hypothetical protein